MPAPHHSVPHHYWVLVSKRSSQATSASTHQSVHRMVCVFSRCLVFRFFATFYLGKISKDPPFRNEKTECFLLGLLKLNFETVNEQCGACNRCQFFFNVLEILPQILAISLQLYPHRLYLVQSVH